MGQTLLEARSLLLSRGPKVLFSGLSFSVEVGQALILRGPNGVGKTSLLRVLAGLTSADAGEIAIRGNAVSALSATARNAVLYSGHANGLKDDFTAFENLMDQLALDANPVPAAEQLNALQHVGLRDRRDVLARRLSQGQKRRVGLARLAASTGTDQKPIWLLDEPTNALDSEGTALFLQIVNSHLAEGGVAVIATHLPMRLDGEAVELHMTEVP